MAVARSEGGLGLMSCVRENSPPDPPDLAEDPPPHTHEPKKRRFHPLRGLRRMFRRKERRSQQPVTVSADELSSSATVPPAPEENRRSGTTLHSGLSVSHDSVFNPGSENEPSSLSIQRLLHSHSGVQAELVDAVRRRVRDDSDEEDLGLPRSPPSNSPTVTDVLDKVLKENVNKSNHSTSCSDGSLLSMGSSEMDEDSFGPSSGHGSKISLHEKKSEPSSDVVVTSEPLSHSAARHKMSVKPKRTHGAPRKRKSTQLGEVTTLPATPEVNEDLNTTVNNTNTVEVIPETPQVRSVTPDLPSAQTGSVSTAQLKSASLPPGAVPTWAPSPAKLSRSKSSATETEEPEPNTTFFGRLLSRRSGKKKKHVEEPPLELPQKRMDEKGRYIHEVAKFGRHPAMRQRVEPFNISQDRVSRMQVFYPPSPPPPDSPPTKRKEVLISDDEDVLEGRSPLRKVIPLEVDPSIPKRTFVKKSQSFRRDEALPFVSLDTPSLPVGLGTELQTDGVEDLNELTTMEVVDHHLSSERIEETAAEAKTTVMINSDCTDSCEVNITQQETLVKKSLSLDSVSGCDIVKVNKTTSSSENISHQITIPVGSIVDNQIETESPSSPPPHIKPEPRKSLGNKEFPNFYPVPAPRPSKRDSLEAKPPRVPEFLRVQLNHVDSKPSVNVVLSTSPLDDKVLDLSSNVDKEFVQENSQPSSRKSSNSEKSNLEENDFKDLQDEVNKPNVCVAKESIDPNQIKFLNSVKQWSATPYAVSNPNYSIVSIAPPKADEAKKTEKTNVTTNQSIHKTVVIKEVKEKVHPPEENKQDIPPMKVVLRQRSFVNDDKSSNILNTEKPLKKGESKPALQKKPQLKDVFISDLDKSRKLSLERLDSRNQENLNELGRRKSKELSSSEDNIVDRNSFGSSDTLASQDSGEVVLRRKSLSREIIKQKEEEPELLKVFARRSLKVKDPEVLDDLEALSYVPVKSRDSDKENECGDSPPEERKKITVETKSSEKSVPNVAFKYQRSVSSSNDEIVTSVLANSKKDNNTFEKRQRSRTIPDPKIIDPPKPMVAHKVITNVYKEKEVEVISREVLEEHCEKEENVPRFKRIQQRKEEWEKRAQLAMKNP